MGATYTRQSSAGITDGAVIEASDLNNEFDQLLAAFVAASGHTHDGTAAEGGPVTKLLGNTLTFGAATAGTDITVTFDGETSDGVLYWMEDEDHFKFADDIVVDSSKKLYFYDEGGEYISGDGTDLNLVSGADINIPANIGLTFGDDGEKIEGDGTDLTIAGNNINLTAAADVVIPANIGLTFGTGEKIEGDSTDLTITSGADIALTATADINVPSGVGMTFGNDGEKIEGDGTDLTIASSGVLNIAAGGATNQIKITDGTITPITDNDIDLGSASYQFKDAYINGTLEADAITIGGTAIGSIYGVIAGSSSILTTGALDSGSITSGFGAIDNGTSGIRTNTFTAETSIIPDASGGADLGSASAEWGDFYIADDKYINFGSDQNILVGYDETTTDSLRIAATEGAGLAITLMADEGDDAGDEWKLNVADGGTITLGNDIASAGSYVTHLTLTPNSTVTSSNLSLAGSLTLGSVAAAGSDTDKFLVLDGSGNIDYRTGTQVLSDIGGGTGTAALTGSTDNTIVTVTGSNAIAGEANLTFDGTDFLVASTGKVGVRDSAIYLYSSADGQGDLVADSVLQVTAPTVNIEGSTAITLESDAITFGENGDTDIALTFNANSADGVLTWMEDEDYFQFSDDILMATTEKVQFRDTGLYISSNADGDLDVVSDGTAVDSINLESGGGITLDAGTASSGIIYEDDGTEMLRIHNSSSDVIVEAKVQDKDIIFKGDDGGSGVTALTLDMSAGGIATFSAAANVAQQAITSSSNAIAWDASDKPNAYHITTENTTLSAPTNAVEGAFICIEINFNGSHTFAWNAIFNFAADTAPTTTDTDGKTDILVFRYNGAIWQEVGRTLNIPES